jgi:hypothetical protein
MLVCTARIAGCYINPPVTGLVPPGLIPEDDAGLDLGTVAIGQSTSLPSSARRTEPSTTIVFRIAKLDGKGNIRVAVGLIPPGLLV